MTTVPTISFDDLLSGNRLRKITAKIPALGEVEIHEISAAEQWDCMKGHDEKKDDELENHICFWACRFLKGSKPSDEEVEKFRACNGVGVISEIFGAGLSFNASAYESREQTEKK